MDNKEPYRATKLWNEVITAFQNGMPLRKHRRRLQSYNNCFTASEAITWLHCFLMNNSSFGREVTRQQTVNLLQKFVKCHVIESIVVRSKAKEFTDDSHLYRFTPVSQMSKPSALCLIQSPAFGARDTNHRFKHSGKVKETSTYQKENIPECHFVERKLSADEIKLVWERVTLARLEKLFPTLTDNLNEKFVDGLIIKHNVTRLSKTGVVCLMDKTDDIPHWVISAMKCLANWPNASGSGSCLPNYPGFEKDVFKVVRDFFINPQVPLVPQCLTPLLLQVFCHFTRNEYIEFNKVKSCVVASSSNGQADSSRQSSSPTKVKTSTPVHSNDSESHPSLKREISGKEISQGRLLLDDPEVMWDYPSVVFYETDFATSNPVTRVVSGHSTPRSRSQSYTSSIGSIESVSTLSVCSRSYQKEVLHCNVDNFRAPLKSWTSNLYLQDEVKEPFSWHKNPLYFSDLADADRASAKEDTRNHSMRFTTSEENVCEAVDLDTSNASSDTVIAADEINGSEQKRCGKLGLYSSSISSCSVSSSQINQTPQRSVYQSILGREYSSDLKHTFQLMLLLLPSANRRQLHLLLRLINKILKNGKFILNVKTSMRHYLLETFMPAVLQSDQNILVLFELMTFLLDNGEFLFQVPSGLKQEVDEYSRSCFGRIRYTVDDTCSLTYCEMVSKQQYEEQKVSISRESLKSLLNSIVVDPNLSDKDKKKRLKQFKENHPDVYYMHFSENQRYLEKPKQTLLNRLANLRM